MGNSAPSEGGSPHRVDGFPGPAIDARLVDDLSTTLGIYGHQDQRDLERAMEALARTRAAGSLDDAP